MIRLRLLQAAALLLMLQLSSVEGLFNLTGCDEYKACWASEDCLIGSEEPPANPKKETFNFLKEKVDYSKYLSDCTKYFIVEPGTDDIVFEFMHSRIDKDKKATIGFNGDKGIPLGQLLFCHKQEVTAGKAGKSLFNIVSDKSAAQNNLYCRFTVSEKTRGATKEFWSIFTGAFQPIYAYIKIKDEPEIDIADYNPELFLGRVPCKPIFLPTGEDKKEHHIKPDLDVDTRIYSCPSNYTMSHKLFKDTDDTIAQDEFTITTSSIECTLGEVLHKQKKNKLVASAKCHRLRTSLCADVPCTNCTGITNKVDQDGAKAVVCKTKKMVANFHLVALPIAHCHEDSTPTQHLWSAKGFTKTMLTDVKCVDELECNEIAPFAPADCANCSNATFSGGLPNCPRGTTLSWFDGDNTRHTITNITCDKENGKWEIVGQKYPKGTDEAKKMKLSCIPQKPETVTEPPAAPQNAGNTLLYVGCSIGALLLLLLILLLIYWLCCRKRKEKPKEESAQEPIPPSWTGAVKTTTDTSVVEELPPPPPIAPASNESSENLYSGKRVQFVNVSKEVLREIEPSDGRFQEFSARDMSEDDRSKASQVSQVGGTTDGAITFTGGRGTEATNEVSKTVANGDDVSRSDVSNGKNSTVGDQSQTGGGGNTRTIGDAEKKNKKEKKKAAEGPRVAFRERVSYDTDTKTRDKSSAASMHTAPEQPPTKVDTTQAEGSTAEKKTDDPSRLTASKARANFGKERTRTTQNTNQTNDEAQRSSMVNGSRMTADNSRTG